MSVWAASLPLVEPDTERERKRKNKFLVKSPKLQFERTRSSVVATDTHRQAAQAFASVLLVHAGHHMAIYKGR